MSFSIPMAVIVITFGACTYLIVARAMHKLSQGSED